MAIPTIAPLILLLASFLAAGSGSLEILESCRASRFQDSCADRLSAMSPPLPPFASASDIVLAVFRSSLRGLITARSAARSILESSASDRNQSNAAHNCIELLSYSSHRLTAVAEEDLRSPNARAWAGAALLYQYDCWSALKYVNGTTQVASAMDFLSDLVNRTADGLSMLAALQRYGSDLSFWAPPQTERDGYWGPPSAVAADFAAGGVPPDLPANLTVCKQGRCDHGTVQAAVDASPENEGRFVIRIFAGQYDEIVRVPFEKTNLVFVGDGMGRTVITGNLSADQIGLSTYNTATVAVAGDGFMARDLTICNTAGSNAHQAVAFRSDGDLTMMDTVEFVGNQDTLYAHSLRQYYKSCVVRGTVDFIFGNSAAVFDGCLIIISARRSFNPQKGESDTVAAHGRTDPAQPTGFVFCGCRLNGSEEYWEMYRREPGLHRAYLGRPWKEYARTVFISCYLDEILMPQGWMPWSGDFALSTLFYGEYGSVGPRSSAAARVPWSTQISPEHLRLYSPDNFIQGNLWIPQLGYRPLYSSKENIRRLGTYAAVFMLLMVCLTLGCAQNRSS